MTNLAFDVINIEPNTPEWLEWRSTGVGSSDVSVVMGLAPKQWKMTRRKLFLQKKGLEESETNEYITSRGHRLEPRARALLEMELALDFSPCCVQSRFEKRFLCSLDGFNQGKMIIAEFKYQGLGDHKRLAKDGYIPSYYFIQMQYQLLVTGAKFCWFVSYNPEMDNIHMRKVFPHPETQELIKVSLLEFFQELDNDQIPALTRLDPVEVDDEEGLKLIDELKLVYLLHKLKKKSLDETKVDYEKAKRKILDHVGHTFVKSSGIEVKETVKGSVIVTFRDGSDEPTSEFTVGVGNNVFRTDVDKRKK